MNKCQALLILFVGIQIGIRLPAAKRGAEQFKNSVSSKVVEFSAGIVADEINAVILNAASSYRERHEKDVK